MSGFMKYICQKETTEAISEVNKYIKNLIPLLPDEYNLVTIEELLRQYYPFEVLTIEQKYKYYLYKEKSLINKGKQSRYTYFESLDKIIMKTYWYKTITSKEYIASHKKAFNAESWSNNITEFSVLRNSKIKKRNIKIQKALEKTQQMEPEFLDVLMGLYDKKNTTQKDRVYILKELEKYYCDKVLLFFGKKIDTEINRQLREMAFYHYQSLGFQPRLRKQRYIKITTKNKKRRKFLKEVYAKEKFSIDAIPNELEYRINNSREQKIKTYDYFISHSSTDFNQIQSLIQALNKNGKNIYCDWISDTDYLKRHLVGEATLAVILKRISQCKEVIFVVSENSINSKWCKYELNDSRNTDKHILYINKFDIVNKKFLLKEYTDDWYIDEDYKNIKLF